MKIFVALPVFNLINPSVKENQDRIFKNTSHQIVFSQVIGASPEHARQILINRFLETDCEYYLTLDADIVYLGDFDPLERLISLNKDIVGGVYVYKKPPCLPVFRPIDLQEIYERDGKFPENYKFNIPDEPFEVCWLGNGFKLIKRNVIEEIRKIIKVPNLPVIYKGEYLSEDFAPVSPDTMITMKDFTQKEIQDIEEGEEIISFDEESNGTNHRKYRFGTVLGKIEKEDELIEIITDKGVINTTSEHLWLTKRMWKRPVGQHKNNFKVRHPAKFDWIKTEELREGDYLLKIMSDEHCNKNQDYMIGYIQGIFEDASFEKNWKYAMLRIKDIDAIDRAFEYLSILGIKSNKNLKPFIRRKPQHSDLYKLYIGINDMPKFKIYDDLVLDTKEYSCGFLSGIFDADGCNCGAYIQISNLRTKNPKLREKINRNLNNINIPFQESDRSVNITGITNSNRFFVKCNPAISRKKHFRGQSKDNKELDNQKAKIISINKTGIYSKVFCLITDTRTFIANGFATHNCDQRARELGFKVFADPKIKLGHMGQYCYELKNYNEVK